jgi:hypothetical protein
MVQNGLHKVFCGVAAVATWLKKLLKTHFSWLYAADVVVVT